MSTDPSPRRAPRSAKKGVLFALLVIALSVASFAASGLVASGTPQPETCANTVDNGCCATDSGASASSSDIVGCNPCDVQKTDGEGGDSSGCNPCDVQKTDGEGGEGGDSSGCNPCDVQKTDDEGGDGGDSSGCNPCDLKPSSDGEGGDGRDCNPCDTSGEISSADDGGEGHHSCVTYDATTQVIAEGDPGTDITGDSAPLGTTVHDEATVTVTDLRVTDHGGEGDSVTQNVNFTLFPGLECTGDPLSSEDVAIDAPDTVSSQSRTLPAGSYSYLATYTRTESEDGYGDDTYDEGDDDTITVAAACEPFTVDPIDPEVVTTILDNEDVAVTTVALGTQVRDTAAVSGIESFDPTGGVSFDFYAGADCAGEPVAAGSAEVDGDGVADGSDVTDPLAAGSYSYLAHYSGDNNYNAIDAACENLVVEKADSATATTILDDATDAPIPADQEVDAPVTVRDTAAVTSENEAFAPTGEVTFQLFANGDCSAEGTDAGAADLDGDGVADGSDPQAFAQNGVLQTQYSFQATYAGDGNFNGSVGPCEPFTVNDLSVLGELVNRGGNTQVAAALAFTGSSSTPWALFGALLVGLGGLVIVATRRRGGATS